jgi:hypothetical protein
MSNQSESQVSQILLRLQYQELARRGLELPQFSDAEFRCNSQNGEDGILHLIFSLIGTTNRRAVEICAGDGFECNAANLIINHGWNGLLIDGDADQVTRGNAFYSTCRTTWVAPPRFINAWITAENVEPIVESQGIVGPIDLLSLDLDGNDFWVWRALDCVTPRVVVLEFNAACGPERSLSISYDPDFRLDFSVQPYRCGASLPAFVKLGRQKGYRLVGVESRGINAFFIRNGIGEDHFPRKSVQECFAQTERLKEWSPAELDVLLSGPQTWEDV